MGDRCPWRRHLLFAGRVQLMAATGGHNGMSLGRRSPKWPEIMTGLSEELISGSLVSEDDNSRRPKDWVKYTVAWMFLNQIFC